MAKITRIDMGADVNEFNLVTIFYEDGGKLSVSVPSPQLRSRALKHDDILEAVEKRLGIPYGSIQPVSLELEEFLKKA